jgi:hypothetical protein
MAYVNARVSVLVKSLPRMPSQRGVANCEQPIPEIDHPFRNTRQVRPFQLVSSSAVATADSEKMRRRSFQFLGS